MSILLANRGLSGNNQLIGDRVSDVSFYFGLRKVLQNYSGYACELRRSSDDALSDFGFSGVYLDTAAVQAWAGGADVYIRTVYNQFDNVKNFVQTTDASQPQLIIDSPLNYYMLFDGIDDYIDNAFYVPNSNSIISVTCAIRAILPLVVDNAQGNIFSSGGTSATRIGAQHSSNTISFGKRISGVDYVRTVPTHNSMTGVYNFENTADTPSTDDLDIHKDLTVIDTADGVLIPSTAGVFRIGNNNVVNQPLYGKVHEYWLTGLGNRSTLVTDIKKLYGL